MRPDIYPKYENVNIWTRLYNSETPPAGVGDGLYLYYIVMAWACE